MNIDGMCFEYSVTVAVNNKKCWKVPRNPERILKIKPFVNKYNWKKVFSQKIKRQEKVWNKL